MFVRRWVTVASIALSIGSLCSRRLYGPRLFVTWWPEGDGGILSAVVLALAIAAWVTARLRNPLAQGVLLTVSTLAAMGIYAAGEWTKPLNYFESLLLLFQILICSALVAATNHVLRRQPGRQPARILSALGGMGVLIAFLSGGQKWERPLLWELIRSGIYGRQWATAGFATLLMLYAIFGILNAMARPPAALRRRLISVYGYGLLGLFPLALLHEWLLTSTQWSPELNPDTFAFLFRFWMLGTGHAVLLATGIAVWLEALSSPPEPVITTPGSSST